MNQALRDEVTAWIAGDPDEVDRATLRALVEVDDEVELARRFAAPLTFGTAGLRGPVMAGPSGMNRLTVRRATQGVVAWLDEIGVDASKGGVVGRDARRGSESFNDEAVGVLLGAGAYVVGQLVAITTRGAGGHLHANDVARAGTVLDDETLAQHTRQTLRQQATDDVRGAAGRLTDDHFHRLRRPRLLRARRARQGACRGKRRYSRNGLASRRFHRRFPRVL